MDGEQTITIGRYACGCDHNRETFCDVHQELWDRALGGDRITPQVEIALLSERKPELFEAIPGAISIPPLRKR